MTCFCRRTFPPLDEAVAERGVRPADQQTQAGGAEAALHPRGQDRRAHCAQDHQRGRRPPQGGEDDDRARSTGHR